MLTKAGVAEASARILTDIAVLPPVRVPLRDAYGSVLASAVRSPVALPPWNNSSMDGYAVRGADIATAGDDAPVTLRVVATIAAGGSADVAIGAGEAVRIMTGAPVPPSADSVVRIEDTDGGSERVVVHRGRDAGRNIRPSGEDLAADAIAVDAGTPLGAAHLGVLASVGAGTVAVHRRPRVGILSSGDELVDVDRFADVRAGRRIVASNSYTLSALTRAAGAEPVDLGLVPDDRDAIRGAIERGLSSCDLLLTSGGVSVGAFDYTREVIESLGAAMRLWRVRMRPGAPLGFALVGGVPWLGLPGNPVSAMVTFELFARPALRKMAGHTRLFRQAMSVRVAEPISLGPPLTHFLRVTLTRDGGGGMPTARLTGSQGSGLLTSMARADALLVVPEHQHEVAAGDVLRAIPLGDEGTMTSELEL